MSPFAKATLVAVAAILFALSPFVSGDFGGFDPNRFPVPQIDPPAQPAGYAFSIWGVIYLWLILHGVFGVLKRRDDPAWDATRRPLLLSLAVGATWLAVALQSLLGALVLIWVMLISALLALFKAPRADIGWIGLPLGLYAGWLSAASFVAIAINGAGYGIGPGALVWAWLAVAGLFAFAGLIQLRLGFVPGYGLAVAWALVAVGVQNLWSQTLLGLVAFVGALIFAVLPFLQRHKDDNRDHPSGTA